MNQSETHTATQYKYRGPYKNFIAVIVDILPQKRETKAISIKDEHNTDS